MSKPRTPRTTEQATELLARFAELEGRVARVQSKRASGLARLNRVADAALTVLQAELAEIRTAIEPWFMGEGKTLLPKARKSMELGGCMLGTRTARAKLAHGFADEDAAVVALRGTRLGNQATKVRYSIDRPATLRMLQGGGKTATTLTDLGFRVEPAVDTFFVERAEQAGTVAG